MRWDIAHRTEYRYATPARESFNQVRLQPMSTEQQKVESFSLQVKPAVRVREYRDFYANLVHHFEIPEPHDTLVIDTRIQALTLPWEPFPAKASPFPLSRIGEAGRSFRCHDFLQASRYVDVEPETWRLALDAIDGQTDTWQAAQAIIKFIHANFTYLANSTSVHTHMREVLAQRKGVCQDFAHVALGLCRAVRIPALYVSGYLATETASATHAWIEIFLPEQGWLAMDPTHGKQVDANYLKIAVGRDYADVAPVSGHYKGTQDRKLDVAVRIQTQS